MYYECEFINLLATNVNSRLELEFRKYNNYKTEIGISRRKKNTCAYFVILSIYSSFIAILLSVPGFNSRFTIKVFSKNYAIYPISYSS